jgi:putative transposase
VACRVLNVSRSGYYDWIGRPDSPRVQENALLLKQIKQIHADSRGTYGSPRVHAELTLGLGLPVNLKRVARLMRAAGIQGLYRRRRRCCTVRDPDAKPSADLVNRNFTVDEPNRLWITDITEHPTTEGKLYCAAVMDAYSRLIVGWSIAGHMRTELVTDALGMAIVRRQPDKRADGKSTILHSDHGAQYTSWAFGQRLRAAGLLASMGTVGDCYDNSMMESFWGTLQLELLDTKEWSNREELANAVFEWIETSHQLKVSSGDGSGVDASGLEGTMLVVELAADEAVVELAEHAVEHLPQRGDVSVPGSAPRSVAGFPVRVVADGGQCPHVANRGEAVVFRAPGVRERRAA